MSGSLMSGSTAMRLTLVRNSANKHVYESEGDEMFGFIRFAFDQDQYDFV